MTDIVKLKMTNSVNLLYDAGVTYREIVRILGISSTTVWSILRKKKCINCNNIVYHKAELCRKCESKEKPHFKGKHHSIKSRSIMSEKRLGVKFSEEHKKNLIGVHAKEKHWNWRGGITGFNKQERTKFYRKFRLEVLKRDNFKCQKCGNGGNLQVDHIKKWSKFPDLRFDISNCRTLCVKCHYMETFKRELPIEIKQWGHNQSKIF